MTAIHGAKTVNLALQGGGAHGAFTWGVLDRLLEEDRLNVEGISGTSAGAMNAAMYKTGWVSGGREGAKAQLERFWNAIRKDAQPNTDPIYLWLSWISESLARSVRKVYRLPVRIVTDLFQQNVSPYQWNPLDIHPLRRLLDQIVDWDALCRSCAPHVFICATNVRTGRIRVFEDTELSTDALLASACLPTLFQAVEIDGEEYWDGGYTGNPALFPLIRMDSRDIVIVHINPIERDRVPRQAGAILNRINEISFNSSLMRELRAIDTVRQLLESGDLQSSGTRDPLIHSIRNDEVMTDLGRHSKVAPEPSLIDYLRDEGRAAADGFLVTHWNKLNREESADLRSLFE